MAKEIREIITFHEQIAAGDIEKMSVLNALRAVTTQAEERGALSSSMPNAQDKSSATEVTRQPLSPETQRLVEKLKKDGYAVYDTEGKTPRALQTEGMPFWYINPALMDVSAPSSLLAFKPNPSEFFLKGTQNIPYEQQLKLLEKEKERIDKKYRDSGLVARVGKPSEWTELGWKHFKATDEKVRIFGEDYGYNWTWTDTYESDKPGAGRANVGYWDETLGFGVGFNHPDGVDPYLGLAPLVEIPRK